jgi:hypothetical protein
MLLSEARPRPYRTSYEERRGKYSPVVGDYAETRQEDIKGTLNSYKYKDKDIKDKTIAHTEQQCLAATIVYNSKYEDKFAGKEIRLSYYNRYTDDFFSNRVVYFYLYSKIDLRLPKQKRDNVIKAGLMTEYGLKSVMDLFPELKDVCDDIAISFGSDSNNTYEVDYEIRLCDANKIDMIMSAEGRAEQLRKRVEAIYNKLSIKEIVDRIIKFVQNLLSSTSAVGDSENVIE